MTTNNNHAPIIITPGEPAGIGPDLVVMLAQQAWPIKIVICADLQLLINRAKQLQLPIYPEIYQYNNTNNTFQFPGKLTILPITTSDPVTPGKLNINNSQYVINTLKRACDGCINKEFSALVTGPVHKGIINDRGIKFTGHTEFLGTYSKSKKVVMMLTNNILRIALMTTHVPISKIIKLITKQSLYDTIHVISKSFKKHFNIQNPKILVCGLNPHAGENGHLGHEENTIIIPTLNMLRKKGYNLTGPFPADTIFQKKYLQHADIVLTMYHDQGLPVLKTQSFGKSVNITLGLPFIRTSVDHGTAIELAGSQSIKNESMNMAIKTAIHMLNQSI